MAEEVFMSEGKLVARGGSGVPPTALAGGDELFFTEITSNFASTATSYIDVTGLTGTLTVPDGPYIVELFAPAAVAVATAQAAVQLVTGSTVLIGDAYRATAANDSSGLYLRQRFPSTMHSPAPGSVVTYKGQMKSTMTTSTVTLLVDFGGRVNPCYIRAYRT